MNPAAYLRDWTDGLTPKSLATIAFMYFTCVAPMVGFGQLTGRATAGALGVPHFFVASALAGVIYAVLSGQPMTFIAPTGLTFAFVSSFYALTQSVGLPFLGFYAWSGLWCSAFMVVLACANACNLVSLVTRFTDDVFNGLIVVTFLVTATKDIASPFLAAAGLDKTVAFTEAALAIGTFLLAWLLHKGRSNEALPRRLRSLMADFGPIVAIAATTLIARSPLVTATAAGLRGLAVPRTFDIGRPWLVPLFPSGGVPAWVPLAAVPSGLLLTLLFFLDQNITSRVVNNPVNGLRKGATYHVDLLALSASIAVSSLLGLPWMVGATVQSLAHIRAMTGGGEDQDTAGASKGNDDGSVVETRITGFATHTLIGCSAFLLPMLRAVPAAAVNGLFLYLGVRMMQGNGMIARIPLLFRDAGLPPHPSLAGVRPQRARAYTALQLGILAGMWFVRSMPSTSLLFPSMILLLVGLRLRVLPRFLSRGELEELDELTPAEQERVDEF